MKSHNKLFLIFLFLIAPNITYADNAIVNIDFDLSNIAALEERSPKPKLWSIIPYEEIQKVHDNINEQTSLGRTINISWHIVNYEPNEDLFSNITKGFHVFDFTWFRLRMSVKFRKRNGQWASMVSMPTGFYFKPHSKAIIHGYGEVPVLISPTICPGGMCLGGGGEHQGEFKETIEREIINDDYRIQIIKYPVTKSVYLKLIDSELMNRKLELQGNIILGDSAITTEKKPFYFPFDKYSFNYFYTSYYPSEIIFNMNDIEDLDLTIPQKIKKQAVRNEKLNISMELLRKDRHSNFWKILLYLIPVVLQIIEKKLNLKWWVRWPTYIFTFIAIYISLPEPLNVPKLNFLNIISWSLCVLLLLILEIYMFFKSKEHRKKTSTRIGF